MSEPYRTGSALDASAEPLPLSPNFQSGRKSLFMRVIRPYVSLARLDKPTGIWLLLFPALQGYFAALAVSGEKFSLANAGVILILAAGSVIMRSAGCVINDYFDREFDAKVARTATRPLAAGLISPNAALIFFGILCAFGCVTLLLLPQSSLIVGALCAGMIIFYPLAKRLTNYPQAVLGLVFNAGAPIAYVAAANKIDAAAIAIFLGGALFTFGYDTIYACQDKKDDVIAGVKSSALALGEKIRSALAFSYAFSWFLYGCALAALPKVSPLCYLLIFMIALLKFYALSRFHPDKPELCAALFKHSVWIAGLYALVFFIPTLLA